MTVMTPTPVAASHYKICRTGPGDLVLDVLPLGNAVLFPSLSIIGPGESLPVRRHDEGGVARFLLAPEQVERLLAAPGLDRSPYLGLLCDAFLSVNADDRLWGYGIRIARAGAALPICDADGVPLPTDRTGFVPSVLQRFPAHKGVARGHDILCLV